MGILDEAIKEHLDLKRQHGAGDSELKELEDEAFGPPERPGGEEETSDAAAEAPTEFMATPETGEEPQREDERPAAEHEAAAEPGPAPEAEAEPSHDEDERRTVAEQPTEHFDVEEELATSAKRGPSDEELIEEEMDEPRLAPVDPLADIEEVEKIGAETAPGAAEDDEDDDFWSEQRLSEELDQALEAPVEEAESPEELQPVEETEPLEETATFEPEPLEEPEDAEEPEPSRALDPDSDVLENTPDFLEDAPEDDELWFEQKPPKDFDFDD